MKKKNKQERKMHRDFVNPVRRTSPTLGATKPGRKSTRIVLIQ